MSSRNINDLKHSIRGRRPSQAFRTKDFETPAQVLARWLATIALLYAMASALRKGGLLDQARRCHRLANKLKRGGRRSRRSLADPREMRWRREVVASHLWHFVWRYRLARDARFVPIIPRAWQFTVETLHGADPEKMLAALRVQLVRLGARKGTGFFFAGIDVAYDLEHEVFQVHVHGIASGETLKAIRRLKGVPRFKSERCSDLQAKDLHSREGVRVIHPVGIKRKPLRRMPRVFLYILKQQWFAYQRVNSAHEATIPAGTTTAYRSSTIPEPANSSARMAGHVGPQRNHADDGHARRAQRLRAPVMADRGQQHRDEHPSINATNPTISTNPTKPVSCRTRPTDLPNEAAGRVYGKLQVSEDQPRTLR